MTLTFQNEVKLGHGLGRLRPLWMFHFEQFGDDFPGSWRRLQDFLREFLEKSSDIEVLDFLQALSRQPFITSTSFDALRKLVESERIAYRLVGNPRSTEDKPTLLPVAGLEQANAIETNWARIIEANAEGAAEHLRRASARLSAGAYNDAVRESIHAVESAAKTASGDSGATLTDALKVIERSRSLHPALKQALVKLYGWTSDTQGIRHALIDTTDSVSEEMALFMFSACAAFSAWLLSPQLRLADLDRARI